MGRNRREWKKNFISFAATRFSCHSFAPSLLGMVDKYSKSVRKLDFTSTELKNETDRNIRRSWKEIEPSSAEKATKKYKKKSGSSWRMYFISLWLSLSSEALFSFYHIMIFIPKIPVNLNVILWSLSYTHHNRASKRKMSWYYFMSSAELTVHYAPKAEWYFMTQQSYRISSSAIFLSRIGKKFLFITLSLDLSLLKLIFICSRSHNDTESLSSGIPHMCVRLE